MTRRDSTRRRPERKPPVVTIQLLANWGCLLSPPPFVRELLTYTERRFIEDEERGYRELPKTHELWWPDRLQRDGISFPCGCLPRVVESLREQGYAVVLADGRQFGENFRVDKEYYRAAEEGDRRLLAAVRRQPCGQIVVPGPTKMIEAMAQICRLYPRARVLIPVATRSTGYKIRSRLAQHLDCPVQIDPRPDDPVSRVRVWIVPAVYTRDYRAWDIVLYPDPVGATNERIWNRMHDFITAGKRYNALPAVHRLYSFVMPGTRLDPLQQLRLESLSGPVIYDYRPKRAQVRTLWLPTPSCPPVPENGSGLDYKRAAYWANGRRNDFVAAVARAIAKRDLEKLDKYGFPFGGEEPLIRHWPEPTIALLVESVEHARELAQRLPHWEVLDAVPNTRKDTGSDRRERLPRRSIATAIRAAQIGLDADVVIRAAGSSGTRCFREFPPLADEEDRRDVLVVDFTDSFDPRAERDVRRRRQEYERAGWRSCSRVFGQQGHD